MQRRTLVGTRDEAVRWPSDRTAIETEDLRSFLTISRTSPGDIGEREVIVRLNHGRRVQLSYGESVTDEIRPGLHHVRVHNTLMWRTLHLAVEPGEHLELLVVNSGRWWTYSMAAVLGSAPLFLNVEVRSRN